MEDAAGRRILIGVGRVLHVGAAQEYEYMTTNLKGKLRGMLWERMIQHSIRPNFNDGFLLPYHVAQDLELDPVEFAAFSPTDRLSEFSYASELVSHDGAIASLLSCAESLNKANSVLPGPWGHCLQWIDARLSEIWKARGPCPGLGSALTAFGLQSGTFVARVLTEKAGNNADPWPLVDKMFADPPKHLPEWLAKNIGKTLCSKWSRLPDDRRKLLKLVSRFEITPDQATTLYVQEERAKAGIDTQDTAILANPYLLYELTRLTVDPVSVWTVDKGVFPDEVIRTEHPLPEPTALDAGTDARRVRALTVKVLEDSAAIGNTLFPQGQVVLDIRNLTLQPPCAVDADLMNVAKDDFGDVISEVPMADDAPALQLGRLTKTGDVIRKAIHKRTKGRRMTVMADWRKILDEHLTTNSIIEFDELEENARKEKTAALKELAKARISVLIGSAGTGKTTLLSVLCSHPGNRRGWNLATRTYRKGPCSYGAVCQ